MSDGFLDLYRAIRDSGRTAARDKLKAEIDRLRADCIELANDVVADAFHTYCPNGQMHPADQRRFDRDVSTAAKYVDVDEVVKSLTREGPGE